jgi:glycosyltransferase involved in cell wall biosynthesis
MAHGLPVAAADNSSLPELVGDAGVLFDPYSVDSMVTAMLKLLRDKELRQKNIKNGLEKAAQYTWKKTAEKTLEVYKKVFAGKN